MGLMIAAVLLAAGASTRMGRSKMLLPLPGGGTILSAAVTPLIEAGLDRVVVVVGCDADRLQKEAGLPRNPRLSVVVNDQWEEGMSSSLRRGLQACPDADAALVALGDQPGLTAERVRFVLDAFRPGVRLVVPVHAAQPSHPILFARELFPDLSALTGDRGAREIVQRLWGEAMLLELPPLSDVDTPEDYARLRMAEPETTG